jgi:DNA-binding response OmpR family regulator
MTADRARVLVVDDEPEMREVLGVVLGRAGHEVAEARNGAEALWLIRRDEPDLVLLDVLMPGENGFSVLARIRDVSDVPVLMLTARAAEADVLRGLGGGADDYVTKPFSNAQLLARVGALLRRRPRPAARRLVYRDERLHVDFGAREVVADGRSVRLSDIEWSLLTTLIEEPDVFVPVRRLLEVVWNDPLGIGAERVKFSVLRLRRRLGWGDPATSPIESRRGAGYRYRRTAAASGGGDARSAEGEAGA